MRTLLATCLLLAAIPALAADYVQVAGSTLTFAGHYQGEVFTGRFPGFATRVTFDPSRPQAARLDVVIPLASATTGVPDYDIELRGPSFLDSARFPQARYSATGARPLGNGRYAADGTLSLHGASQPVTLVFTWAAGKQPVLSGKATVKRLAFGVGAGEWADTATLPDEIAVSTRVLLSPAP